MLKILILILFVWLWWHLTMKDSNRDVAAWREKKYGKAVLYFMKVLLMSFLFPFILFFLIAKLFSD